MSPITERSTSSRASRGARRRVAVRVIAALSLAAAAGACLTRHNAGKNVYCDNDNPCTDRMYAKCDSKLHVCVVESDMLMTIAQCDEKNPCGADAPVCDPMSHTCGPCTGDEKPSAACQAADPSRPRCAAGRCVQCIEAKAGIDCIDPLARFCGSDGRCRGCKSATECGDEGFCYEDGSCADPSADYIYVNADTCMNAMPTGAKGAPFCEVADALPLVTQKRRVVKIVGAAVAYVKPVIIAGQDVILAGPQGGRAASPKARFQVIGASAIRVDPNSKVTIDGLTILDSGNDGVTCSSNSKVTLTRTAIDGSHQAGLNAGSCDVTVDASWFEGNKFGAMRFGTGAKYAVTNSFLVSNGSNSPAVVIDPTATGTFSFSTVVNNYATTFGAFDCGMGMSKKLIERSIVMNNGQGAGPSQFFGDCQLVDTMTGGTDSVMGAVQDPPPRLDAATWQLQPKPNPAIDYVPPPNGGTAGTLPDHDGNGRPRPSGAGWDVGADEFQQ